MNFYISILMLIFFQSAWAQKQSGKDFNKSEVSLQSEKKTAEIEHATQNGSATAHPGCGNHNIPKEYQHHDSQSDIEDYLRFVRNNERTLMTRNAACIEIPVNIVVIRRNNESADLDALFHSTMTRINQMCQSSNISIRFKLTRIHKISEADFSTFNQTDRYGELRNRYTDYPRVLPFVVTHLDGGGGMAGVEWLALVDRFAPPENWLHEMGHFLGLIHTHDGGKELVNGSNCSTAGDLVCDTPAEPANNNGSLDLGIIAHVDGNCQYTGTFRDANGELYRPDPYNLMGYSGCKSRFTKGQENRMLYFLRTKYPQIVTSSNCDGSNVPTIASFSDTKCYRFNNRKSGKVMEVGGNNTENGGIVQQWWWLGSKSQVWRVKNAENGFYQIVNGNSGRVLNVADAGTGNGTPINQWEWMNGNNQKWKLTPNTEGYYTITAQHSGKTLDVYAAEIYDGAKILHWDVNNQANQQWQISETTCPAGTVSGTVVTPIAAFSDTKCYRFNNSHSGKVMEVGGNSTENGGIVQQWGWLGSKSQVWRVKNAENGFYQIVNGNSGRVLNVADAGTGDGTPINQWEWSSGNHQKWKLTPNAEGDYTITAQHSGKTLDVYAWEINDGAKILHWAVNNQANQKWQIAETTCPAGTVTVTGGGSSTLECEANVNNGGWQILGNCAVTIPAGQRLELSANPNGASSYQWTGPNGFSGTGNSDGNILVSNAITSSQAGTYTVTFNSNGALASIPIQVTVTGGGGGSLTFECEANVNNGGWQNLGGNCAVTVPAGQRLELSANPNGASSYQWMGPNGFSGTGNADGNILVSDAITPSQAGTYTVTFNSGGALASLPINVTVTGGGLTVAVNGSTTVCSGQTTTLTASGGTTYKWSNGSTNASITVGVGTYTVTATNTSGSTGVKTVTVTQSSTITASISGITTICSGQTTTLTASGGSSYRWSNGSTNASITVGVGTYTVTATNAGGCTGTKTVTVTQSSNITASISGSTTVCSGQTTTLTASGGASYKWSNGSTNASITIGVGTYTVTATNASGCTGTKTVTVTQSSNSGCSIVLVCEHQVNDIGSWSAGLCNVTVKVGDKLVLGANPNGLGSYQWSGPNGFSGAGDANGNILVSNSITTAHAGNYTVKVQSGGQTISKTMSVTVTGTSTSNGTFSATKCYRFNIRHSGKVMEVGGHSTVNGGNVQQWSWYGAKSQIWRVKDIGSGLYQIVNGNSGRFLDVAGVSTAAGANVHQWQWLNANNQKWKLTRNTEGYYVITAQHSGQALDVSGAGTQDGANIVQWPVSNGTNQQFQIAETACPAGTVALQSAYILTAEGRRDGSKAVINWISNANQQADYFVVEKLNDKSQDFEKLALVNAKYSLTDDENFYSITDNNPIEGENYYRIALYQDGETTPQYSGLITVDFSHLTNYHLYPNPANDIVNIELEAVQNSEVTILITDLSGKIIQQTPFEVAPKTAQIAINNISNGQYFIHIDAKNHRKVVKKLTIIR